MVDESAHVREVVGAKAAAVLEKSFGIFSVGEFIRHYPRRYVNRDVLTPLAELADETHVTVLAEVVKMDSRPMRNRRGTMQTCVITDGTARLSCTFFSQPWRRDQLTPGRRALFAGKLTTYRGSRQLTHPACQLLDDDDGVAGSSAGSSLLLASRIPIYPATAAFASWDIAKSVWTALDMVDLDEDPLPVSLREQHALIPLGQALRWIHRPETATQEAAAKKRLRFEEAFVMQIVLAQRRVVAALEPATPRAPRSGGLLEAFDAQLPFTLTAGQREVSAELMTDLSSAVPMHRLLQGEVGSGKTVVALRAMLAVVDSGGQAALLAPTEVLAQQHARSIAALLGPLGMQGQLGAADQATSVALVTGSQPAGVRREMLLDIGVGNAGIVVGTHALLQKTVQFFDLGLVVVDEQHRFGVEQRDALRAKAPHPPHVLVMTATPIPRTVAMTVYGDLETSTLRELPAGRQPITTSVVPPEQPSWLDRAWQRVREEVAGGRQAYVVCPRIDGDDAAEQDSDGSSTEETSPWSETAAVQQLAPTLADGQLAGLRVDLLHGRLSAEAKDGVMRRFTDGEIDVLVATTVIEVGVDVPNATVMVVMDADRFGISQLHQLRGRVGRGAHPGLCLLVTTVPAPAPARERLDGVAATLDGFELARLDVEQRREGDVLGASQSGNRSQLKLLRLLRDEDVIAQARADAVDLISDDPALDRHPTLRAAVESLSSDRRADYLGKT